MYDRIIKLINEENFNKITTKTVAVIGLGGVGGYAVEGLIRSGIKKIIIVDYDNIDITNLNRQIITNNNNIGLSKTEVMKEHILNINSTIEVIAINKKLEPNNLEELFKYKIDYLIDACDTIIVKEKLIKLCIEKNINIISCMGTGNKLNPSELEITDIWKTSYDPIAKKIRRYLKEERIYKKIPVVYSKEQNDKFTGSIPSMMFVPATAGLLCSNYVIKSIINEK